MSRVCEFLVCSDGRSWIEVDGCYVEVEPEVTTVREDGAIWTFFRPIRWWKRWWRRATEAARGTPGETR